MTLFILTYIFACVIISPIVALVYREVTLPLLKIKFPEFVFSEQYRIAKRSSYYTHGGLMNSAFWGRSNNNALAVAVYTDGQTTYPMPIGNANNMVEIFGGHIEAFK
jgi:hypothetical protein